MARPLALWLVVAIVAIVASCHGHDGLQREKRFVKTGCTSSPETDEDNVIT